MLELVPDAATATAGPSSSSFLLLPEHGVRVGDLVVVAVQGPAVVRGGRGVVLVVGRAPK